MLNRAMLYRLLSLMEGDPEELLWTDFKYLIESQLLRWNGTDVEITEMGKQAVTVALERVKQFMSGKGVT